MNFYKSLKDIPVNTVAIPGVLLHTDRIFNCDGCRVVRTGWRFLKDGFETPCCSDECLDFMEERRLNEEKEELMVAARIDEHHSGTASAEPNVLGNGMPMSGGSDAGRQSELGDTEGTSAQTDLQVSEGAETHQQTSARVKRSPEAGLAPADHHVVLEVACSNR